MFCHHEVAAEESSTCACLQVLAAQLLPPAGSARLVQLPSATHEAASLPAPSASDGNAGSTLHLPCLLRQEPEAGFVTTFEAVSR